MNAAIPLRPGSPRDLTRRALAMVLVPIPLALFFWMQEGGRLAGAVRVYWAALIMSVSINVLLLAVELLVAPRLRTLRNAAGPAGLARRLALFAVTGLAGTFVGALIVRATIMPGLMGSPRVVLLMFVYFLIFLGLAIGVILAVESVQRLEERLRADQELRLARRIQSAFLPTEFATPAPYDVFAMNVPSREVSGDFYDLVAGADGTLLLAIADVSGKGVPAALLSAMLQASLRTQAAGAAPVARMLAVINGLLLQQQVVGRFATFFLARLDAARGRLTYSNAGHNPPLLCRAGGAIETLETGGTVVGILPAAGWDEGTVALEPGDRLVLYTDGITEAGAGGGALFGEERLREVVRALPAALPGREVAMRVLEAVDRFTGGAEPDDDRTLLVLRVAGSAA